MGGGPVKRHAKRQPKLYRWQRLRADSPDYEKQYVRSLTEGLEKSETVWELISGLTVWLGQVAIMERQRTESKIVLPNEVDKKTLRLH